MKRQGHRGFGWVYQPTYRDKHTNEKKLSAIWWIAYSFRGEKRRESSGSTNKNQALALLKQRIGEAGLGRARTVDMQKTTFADLVDKVRSTYARKQNTSTPRMERAVKVLEDYFGRDCKAMEIDYDRIDAYITSRLNQGIAHATVQYEIAMLRLGFREAAKAGKALVPAFPIIAVNNARQGFFEKEEFERLLTHLPSYLQPVMRFAHLTSWRVQSEVLTLTWDQVNFTTGMVRLESSQTKNKEPRSFPFAEHPELLALLRQQYAQRGETAYVFHRHGQPIKSYSTAWENARNKAGLPHRLVHDLRRTAVRNLRRAGVPEQTAMKLTGHKTRTVFDRYDIQNEEDKREAVEKLAGVSRSRVQDLEQQLTQRTAELATITAQLKEAQRRLAERAKSGQSQEADKISATGKYLIIGAGDRDRTGTGLVDPRDFKSLASAYSATPARVADFNIASMAHSHFYLGHYLGHSLQPARRFFEKTMGPG